MPLYEYECSSCSARFDSIEKDPSVIPACPYCHDGCGVKVMSAPNFRITGFSERNGYNLPNYSDVVDANGYKKDRWGR